MLNLNSNDIEKVSFIPTERCPSGECTQLSLKSKGNAETFKAETQQFSNWGIEVIIQDALKYPHFLHHDKPRVGRMKQKFKVSLEGLEARTSRMVTVAGGTPRSIN